MTNQVRFDEASIEQLPDLRLIAVSATGYECIDVAACRAAGITVTNLRDWSTPAVAEHALAIILTIRRQILSYRGAIEAEAWQRSHFYGVLNEKLPQDLFASTLAMIGLGALGMRLADQLLSSKSDPPECKDEAVRQILRRGHQVADAPE